MSARSVQSGWLSVPRRASPPNVGCPCSGAPAMPVWSGWRAGCARRAVRSVRADRADRADWSSVHQARSGESFASARVTSVRVAVTPVDSNRRATGWRLPEVVCEAGKGSISRGVDAEIEPEVGWCCVRVGTPSRVADGGLGRACFALAARRWTAVSAKVSDSGYSAASLPSNRLSPRGPRPPTAMPRDRSTRRSR